MIFQNLVSSYDAVFHVIVLMDEKDNLSGVKKRVINNGNAQNVVVYISRRALMAIIALIVEERRTKSGMRFGVVIPKNERKIVTLILVGVRRQKMKLLSPMAANVLALDAQKH